MKENNFTISSKSIFIASILVLTLTSAGLLLPDIIAEHGKDGITKPLAANSQNIVNFRDTTNVLPQSLTLTIDTSQIEQGFFNITAEEKDANLDSSAVDVTQNASANSYQDPSFLLEERQSPLVLQK